jgi:hypothetical protein
MLIFLLFVACMMSVLGYAIGTIIMAALGDPIAKAIIKIFVISWIVLTVLIYLFAYA